MRTTRHRRLLGLWVALLAVWCAPAGAADAQRPADCGAAAHTAEAPPPSPDLPYGQGVLFRVSTPEAPVSYVYGTVHSEDPRILKLPAPVEQALEGAVSFTMEAVPTEAAMAMLGSGGVLQSDTGLKELLGPKLFARTLKLVVTHMGLDEKMVPMLTAGLEHMKPWLVMSLLSLPRPRTGRFLDLVLYERAQARAIPVDGLETFEEQLAILDSIPLAHQVALLKDVVCDYAGVQRQTEQLVDLYLRRDLGALMAMATSYQGEHAALHRELMQRIVWDRDRTMAERLLPRLRKGGAFVAIGALHLPGPEGVLWRLRQTGFAVRRVY